MDDNLDSSVRFRCTQSEKAEYVAAKKQAGIRSMSDWIRSVLAKELTRTSVKSGKHGAKLAKKSE